MINNIAQNQVSVTERPQKQQISIANHRYIIQVSDLIVVFIAGLLSYGLWAGMAGNMSQALTPVTGGLIAMTCVLWLFLGVSNDIYSPEVFLVRMKIVQKLLLIGLQMFLVYAFVFFAVGATGGGLPRLPFLYHSLAAFGLVAAWRLATITIAARTAEAQRAIIVGTDASIRQLSEYLREPGHERVYHVIGIVADDTNLNTMYGFPVLGHIADLDKLVKQYDIRELVLTENHTHCETAAQTIVRQYESGTQFVSVPHLYERLSGRIPVNHIGSNWSSILPTDMNSEYNGWHFLILKRMIDIVLSVIGLAVFGLMLPFLALIIKLDSKGGIFYRQKRTGQYGKPFMLTKLRTMVNDAEEKTGPTFAQVGDSRITRVGAFLRKTRLDELPQLLNVLRGEMSLIGPRPERPIHVERLANKIPYYCTRHVMRPGLTGWAQVRYGYGSTDDDARVKLEYDLYYIRNASIVLDLTILVRTVYKVLTLGGL